ncbi:ABC transporter, permease protein [Bifidobacterium pullorum subsp. saeculare DSM 6531 = LMG 14934]|uniref:ABC transporter, permease protein n=1 Tax=Bifidobacterium pullorum subsp. saeculare DSM 6531 = LMG 14934 TaxID=1437611 RepID=A0A087D0E4_9BIFI|nr:sugar ABC transporter permease [Bifidobacterium pullorum]KFI88994.1 ABC transporter, permease protein [Bifidobacterium pullorum subsp. saeculare DSM 6531 = LMG 14934]HJE20731.1 sugar ABC transporter permease [Bifidobacterium pullorum]
MSSVASAAARSEAAKASDRPEPTNHTAVNKPHRSFGTVIAPYLFVAPAFIVVFVFVVLAALNTFRLAFTDSTLLKPGKFVGFQNFIDLFQDEYFLTALLNSSLYVVCVVPFMVILPLILANLVKGNGRIMGFFRTAFYMPVVMSAVVVGMIWTNLLDSQGLINSILKGAGIIEEAIPFLTNRWGILFSSMFVTIWLGLGYYMVIYLTALANIDESLYEAAALDGAGPVRQFVSVTMPGVRSTMVLIMMLSTISAFRVFNEVYVLTNGTAGPGGMDMTMSMLIKNEGTGIQARTGYASAISLVVLVIVGTLLIIQQIIQKRGED